MNNTEQIPAMTTFSTAKPITANLTTAGARIRVIATDRADTVVLVEPLDSANKSDLKVAERTEVEFSAGELSVRTRKSGDKAGSIAITVELPTGSGLVLNTAWSDLHADGSLGDCELNLTSGQVKLDRIAGLGGNLSSGDAEIGQVTGSVDVEGGAAGLRIGEVDGTVRYQGATGTVRIGHARSDVHLGGSGGRFDIDRADGDVIAKGSACPIRVGRITRGRVDLTNASGGIEIGIGPRTTAVVDADSTKGTVRNTLPTPSEQYADQVEVYARTRRDDIVIHPAAG